MSRNVPEIFFWEEGKGDAVVFLHGFLESSEIWKDYVNELSNDYHCICIDLPGHGKSSVIGNIHSMREMAEEVKNILEIIGIESVVLVGHSMGGYVAMEFYSKYKNYVKGLVLINSHVEDDTEIEKNNRNRTIELVQNDHKSFITSFYPTLFSPTHAGKFNKEIEWLRTIGYKMEKAGIIASIAGMRDRSNHLQTLKNIKVPVLIIAGDQDSRIPIEKVQAQVKGALNVTLKIFENTGHMAYIEAREAVLKLLKDFLIKIYSSK